MSGGFYEEQILLSHLSHSPFYSHKRHCKMQQKTEVRSDSVLGCFHDGRTKGRPESKNDGHRLIVALIVDCTRVAPSKSGLHECRFRPAVTLI